jgi:hypothetical protein
MAACLISTAISYGTLLRQANAAERLIIAEQSQSSTPNNADRANALIHGHLIAS